MLAPQACVAVEIAGPVAAVEQRAALEHRCSEILGPGRCRILVPEDAGHAGACWHARVTRSSAAGAPVDAPPDEASVLLDDPSEPAHALVRRDITFRANDVPAERWATLGLVIAALVTVEEHSAADEGSTTGPAPLTGLGGGFTPVVEETPAAPPIAVRGGLAATGVASLGVLPHPALGARLEATLSAARLGGDRLSFVARGTLFPASTRATIGTAGAGGDFDLWAVGAGLCGLSARGPWRARLCAGGELARIRAHGVGVAETNDATAWWQAAWVGIGAARRLASHVELVAGVEGAAIFERPTFAIEGAAPAVFSPSPVAVTVALGLAVPFP
jgi:hypothetical protein